MLRCVQSDYFGGGEVGDAKARIAECNLCGGVQRGVVLHIRFAARGCFAARCTSAAVQRNTHGRHMVSSPSARRHPVFWFSSQAHAGELHKAPEGSHRPRHAHSLRACLSVGARVHAAMASPDALSRLRRRRRRHRQSSRTQESELSRQFPVEILDPKHSKRCAQFSFTFTFRWEKSDSLCGYQSFQSTNRFTNYYE